MKVCLYCDSECDDSVVVCPSCGAREFGKKCPVCGTVYNGGKCPECASKEAEKTADTASQNTQNTQNTDKTDSGEKKKKTGTRERNFIIVIAVCIFMAVCMAVYLFAFMKKEAEHDEYVSSMLAETTTEAAPEHIRDDDESFYYDGGYLSVDGYGLFTYSESKKLNSAMMQYYNSTGVGVYMLVTYDTGYSDKQVMNNLYESLFDDETHVLIVYSVTDDGADWHSLVGTDVYNLVAEGSFSGLADLLDATYDSAGDFVNALAGFFGTEE